MELALVFSGGEMNGPSGQAFETVADLSPLLPIDWMHLKRNKKFAQNALFLHSSFLRPYAFPFRP